MQSFFPSHLSMLSLKSESPSFQPLPTFMKNSVIQLLTKACFSVSLLASVQAANAVTITYTAASARYEAVGAPGDNTRPLQLSPGGTAMTGPTRNFIYTGLSGDYPTPAVWTPVGQSTSMAGEQRFDYSFPAANSTNAGPPQVNDWANNLSLSFGSFYLAGSCSFCGPTKVVSMITSSSTGTAKFIGQAPDGTTGNQNQLTSGLYNILFGTGPSAIVGTLEYTAFTNVTSTSLTQQSGGKIIINVNDPNPPTTAVPGPLPVLGAGAAFGYSRRLRRRILVKAKRNQNI
jgi:hypothetical protein